MFRTRKPSPLESVYTMYTHRELKMRTRVSMWGNSLGIRIPQHMAAELGIEDASSVEISIENSRIVIRKVPSYSLDDLLSKIKKDNLHGELDFGDRTGRESW